MNNSTFPDFSILSDDQVIEIHNATLDLLQRVGTDVHNEEALLLLKKAGCEVDGVRVKIPAYIVEEAIRRAPSRFTLYNRTGNAAVLAEGRKSYFGSAPTAPYQIDFNTGEKRFTTRKDITETTIIMDALENIDWVFPLGSIQDVTVGFSDIYEFVETVSNTTKPVAFITTGKENMEIIIEIASIIRGGLKNFVEKPFTVAFPQSVTPLVHTKEGLEVLLKAAELKIPCAYTSCPIIGLTSPISMAGTLVVTNMETLTGVVVSQLKNAGTPLVIGTVTNGINMETSDVSLGAPELPLGVAAYAQLARFYKIPSWGTAGLSDSKILDEQAAIEGTFGCLLNLMAGLNMVHDIGYLDMALTDSVEMVVMMDEVIGMAKRIWKGIPTDRDSLAREVIEKVGPAGNFISENHTAKRFRSELWFPSLMDRHSYAKWKNSGSLRMSDRVNKKTKELLINHKPLKLDDKTRDNIFHLLEQVILKRKK